METKEQKQYYVTVGGQKVPVSEEVYRAYVRPVRAQQRTEKRNKRCQVKGERFGLVRCKDNCAECPYAEKAVFGSEQSLEALAESGFESPAATDMEADLLAAEEKEEQAKRLQSAIACLTERQQYLIREIYFNGKTQYVLAEELGISQQAVSRVLKQAMNKLKKFLENF